MYTREDLAKSKVFQLKLESIYKRLLELEGIDRRIGFSKQEEIEYDVLIKAHKGTAMAWVKQRKAAGLAYDMIQVNYDW